MTEAPERIWAWAGSYPAFDSGDWCNGTATDDAARGGVEYVRSDRIEELEAKLDWVITERDETFALMLDRAQTAEAKLAKAMEALEKVQTFVRELEPYADQGHVLVPALHDACTTLAELTGDKDE